MDFPDWAHPAPVFLDFETQSECDIREYGARTYIEHPSTRVLILALAFECEPGNPDSVEFHVWLPDHIKCDTVRWDRAPVMWPYQLKPAPKQPVRVHRGNLDTGTEFRAVLDSIKDRPLCAHNAYGFDRGIWQRFVSPLLNETTDCRGWIDSLPVARAAGRGGRLDVIGKQLFGVGKDQAKKLLPKLTTAKKGFFEGGFTYPVMNAGDLQAFTRYAVADVELLRRMWREFDSIKVEADVIAVNDRVNARGIQVDTGLLEIIKQLSRYSTATAAGRIEKLTNGELHADNLRSGKVVHEWLGKHGLAITDENGKPCLRKEQVQKFIDSPFILDDHLTAATEIPPVCIDVMRLRMKALRITDAKVERAQLRASADGRIRDLLAYHAAHTGRFSSYGVQIHNLPRPHQDIAAQIEWLVNADTVVPHVPHIDRNEQDVARIFDRINAHLPEPKPGDTAVTVDDVCSALIRPALMARPGHVLCIADYAQVEARGAAWLAGETKMLDEFRAGRDLYKEFAAKMFHCTPVDVTKAQRQIAKSAVLGCIAEGTPVLTNAGWLPIEQVSTNHRVWDGREFVSHDGVVSRGAKECVSVNGNWMTPDHEIYTSEGWVEAWEIERKTLCPAASSADGKLFVPAWFDALHYQESALARTTLFDVSAGISAKWNGLTSNRGAAHNAGNAVRVWSTPRIRSMRTYSRTALTEADCSTEFQASYLDARTRKPSNTGTMAGAGFEFMRRGLTTGGSSFVTSSRYPVGITRHLKLIESIITDTTSRETYGSQPVRCSVGTLAEVRKTYDILNCGPRLRFQIQGMIAHNCQYGLGANKFRVYAANSGCNLSDAGITAEQVIDAYRDEFTKIAGWRPNKGKNFRVGGLWKDLETAVKECVSTGAVTRAAKCSFRLEARNLVLTLPSGRELRYPNVRIEDVIPPYVYAYGLDPIPKATVVYDSERGPKSLYGGLITENVVQAMCRDIMCCALVALDATGYNTVLHVHDEIGSEEPEELAHEKLRGMVRIMSVAPDWAEGFPLEVEGYTCRRFSKSPFFDSIKLDTRSLHA